MNKKMGSILIMAILVGVFLTGCGAKSDSSMPAEEPGVVTESDEEWNEEMSVEDSVVEEKVGFDGEVTQRNKNQKLIYRANMNVEVLQKVDPIIKSMQSFVEEHDGYIEHMEQYVAGRDPITNEDLEQVYMSIRIPHKHYKKTLQTIEDLGTVTSKNSSVEDVTLQYSDIESTLKMYKVEQERLLEMLENESTDVKDMIEIEARLSEVRIKIETQESARRALESLISYDTIELQITQVRRESDISQTKTFSSRIKGTFVRSIDTVIIVSQGLILALTYLLIPMLIVGTIGGVLYMIISRVAKRKKKPQEPKDESKTNK